MFAHRLRTMLPDMTLADAPETTRIQRVAGLTGGRTMAGSSSMTSRNSGGMS
jgi:hypothetical protein